MADQEQQSRRVFSLSAATLSHAGVAAAAAVAIAATPQLASAQTVATTVGTFTPITSPTNNNVSVFEGIRYAAAPEGNLRFAPPTAPTASSGTVSADAFGDACPQEVSTSPISQSEDCLFLNVWLPKNTAANAKLPVFMWIHGGALTFGTGATYDPSNMVNDGQEIVVTINYRLGALGYLATDGIEAASASTFQNAGDAGNYGLMDQEFALQWIQQNIAAFGGDPTKVTVGGESAGGLSTTAILTSVNTAGGLFRSAIIESGGYMLHDVPSQSSYISDFAATFDKDVGCNPNNDAACLRGKSVEQILTAQEEAFGADGISPNFSGKILPNSLSTALSTKGDFFDVPTLQGNNANEGRLFEPDLVLESSLNANAVDNAGGPANFDLNNVNEFCAKGFIEEKCSFTQEINLFLGELGLSSSINSSSFDTTVANDYPLANFPDPFLANNAPSSDEALSQVFTDLVFACNIFQSNSFIAAGGASVYAYEFNDPNAPPSAGSNTAIKAPNDVDGFPSASEHASELAFLFSLMGETFTLSSGEQTLQAQMETYWSNFVVNNNPNIAGSANSESVPSWPLFNSSTTMVQNLVPAPSTPSAFTTFQTEHFCSVWNPIIAQEVGGQTGL